MKLDRIELRLRLVAAAVAVGTAVLLFRAPHVDTTERAAPLLPMPSTDTGTAASWMRPAGTDRAVEAIVAGNLFAPSRRPPSVRYRPPASVNDTGVAGESVVADIDRVAMAETVSPGEPVPALYGTMIGAGGATALMRLDSRVATPQLYREGDRAGGYRVVRISEQAVVLAGPSGSITLRLTPSGKDMP